MSYLIMRVMCCQSPEMGSTLRGIMLEHCCSGIFPLYLLFIDSIFGFSLVFLLDHL
jgi:hypothetical protein